MMGKWLQLLKEIAPRVTRVAVIFNPDTAPFAPPLNRAIETAAPSFGMTVTLAPVHDDAGSRKPSPLWHASPAAVFSVYRRVLTPHTAM
jgi:hypothetical protein